MRLSASSKNTRRRPPRGVSGSRWSESSSTKPGWSGTAQTCRNGSRADFVRPSHRSSNTVEHEGAWGFRWPELSSWVGQSSRVVLEAARSFAIQGDRKVGLSGGPLIMHLFGPTTVTHFAPTRRQRPDGTDPEGELAARPRRPRGAARPGYLPSYFSSYRRDSWRATCCSLVLARSPPGQDLPGFPGTARQHDR